MKELEEYDSELYRELNEKDAKVNEEERAIEMGRGGNAELDGLSMSLKSVP